MTSKNCFVCTAFALLALVLPGGKPFLQAATGARVPAEPYVAIHVSEFTEALATTPADADTPTGQNTTGYRWWIKAWPYFSIYEGLKEAFRSDGTPFVVVSDADISGGALLNADGLPRYPIVISLASEAIDESETAPLRAYVNAGGFLFVGSSAFTRYVDGRARGDFALANEMGIHMVGHTLQNWYENDSFLRLADHRLVQHIPARQLSWQLALSADEIPHAHKAVHYAWQVNATDAQVIANGKSYPFLATKSFGAGFFIYMGALQPLICHGGLEPGTYSYVIFRRAVEWAFERASMPIVKLSPWRFPYDAALAMRHDFENNSGLIQNIESSAKAESVLGIKGDYYFCTGQLRDNLKNDASVIASLRRAVSFYGATIGSHNGGFPNPTDTTLATDAYTYWHWGPDLVLDIDAGKEYAYNSIALSFKDLETWLRGVDNGRPMCGTTGQCPRQWTSPYWDSAREDSYDMLDRLNVTTAGEEKIGPFPHWTISTRTRGARHSFLNLSLSEWFPESGQSTVYQRLEEHDTTSIHQAVDFYYSLGALINLYNHELATSKNPQEYIKYGLSKPNIWSTNAAEVLEWWKARSQVGLTSTYKGAGRYALVTIKPSGVTDENTAVEVVLPPALPYTASSLRVLIDGAEANSSQYRTTATGVKIRIGAATQNVELQYYANQRIARRPSR